MFLSGIKSDRFFSTRANIREAAKFVDNLLGTNPGTAEADIIVIIEDKKTSKGGTVPKVFAAVI